MTTKDFIAKFLDCEFLTTEEAVMLFPEAITPTDNFSSILAKAGESPRVVIGRGHEMFLGAIDDTLLVFYGHMTQHHCRSVDIGFEPTYKIKNPQGYPGIFDPECGRIWVQTSDTSDIGDEYRLVPHFISWNEQDDWKQDTAWGT